MRSLASFSEMISELDYPLMKQVQRADWFIEQFFAPLPNLIVYK